jgi:hypothetical protein
MYVDKDLRDLRLGTIVFIVYSLSVGSPNILKSTLNRLLDYWDRRPIDMVKWNEK